MPGRSPLTRLTRQWASAIARHPTVATVGNASARKSMLLEASRHFCRGDIGGGGCPHRGIQVLGGDQKAVSWIRMVHGNGRIRASREEEKRRQVHVTSSAATVSLPTQLQNPIVTSKRRMLVITEQDDQLCVKSTHQMDMKAILELDSTLHPRDLMMFDSLLDSEFGETEDGGGHYFATIDLRKHCVIISFPAVEAIIMSNKAFILKGGDGFVRLMHKTYYGPKAAGRIVTSLPWEELILECCLMRVAEKVGGKVRRLLPMINGELSEMTEENEVGKPMQLRRLLPLKHQLSSLESEVTESRQAIESLLVDDESMARMSQLDEPSPDLARHDSVETILVAYRRRMDSLLYSLRQMHEEIDNTQELLAMSLDSHRNSILQLNMRVSIATLALTGTAVPASILGMNLSSGLEDAAGGMWIAAAALSILVYGIWFGLSTWLTRGLRFEGRKHAAQLAALKRITSPKAQKYLELVLRDLDLENKGKDVTREELRAAFKKKSPVPFHLTSEELDLIFKFVDLDYSGSISYKEYQEAIRRKGGS